MSIYRVHIGATWRIRLNHPCAASMRPYVKLLWPLVFISCVCRYCIWSQVMQLWQRICWVKLRSSSIMSWKLSQVSATCHTFCLCCQSLHLLCVSQIYHELYCVPCLNSAECVSDRVTSPVNEKLTLKRVVDFVKDKGDENLRDINRKLQRVLEETLTKNMHLQRVSSVYLVHSWRLFCARLAWGNVSEMIYFVLSGT